MDGWIQAAGISAVRTVRGLIAADYWRGDGIKPGEREVEVVHVFGAHGCTAFVRSNISYSAAFSGAGSYFEQVWSLELPCTATTVRTKHAPRRRLQ